LLLFLRKGSTSKDIDKRREVGKGVEVYLSPVLSVSEESRTGWWW
jgi:hypothetical protein